MFFLTRERQELYNAANVFPFGEAIDNEYEEHLYFQLAEYLYILPSKYKAGIIEQTLFSNNALMEEFEEWCYETIEQFTIKSNAIYEKREDIVKRLDPSAQTIFSQSLHDGKILNAEQQGNNFIFLLDMRGGFTVESIIQLVFHDAQTEGNLKGYYVYDELISTEDGFALRVLSSFGSPYEEWTIFFKDVTANYLYRPTIYSEPGEITTALEYVTSLNFEDKYYMLKDYHIIELDLTSVSQTANGIYAGGELLGQTCEEVRERIYCATYEHPYAYLSEPIPVGDLKFAMFDVDQSIRVRAFNTIFELGEKVADIVNEALRKANGNTEDNMYFDIMASHFHKLGCLEDDVKQKWVRE